MIVRVLVQQSRRTEREGERFVSRSPTKSAEKGTENRMSKITTKAVARWRDVRSLNRAVWDGDTLEGFTVESG